MASAIAPSGDVWVIITSGTRFEASSSSVSCWMTEAIEMLWAAQDAGDFGHHAGPVIHVEAEVETAGHAGRIAGPHGRLALASTRGSAVRKVIAVRPMTVLIRSATTAEAVGIWPAPSPWKKTRPTASPTTRTAL